MTEEYYGCRGTHGLVCVALNRVCCATYWFNPNILLHEKHYSPPFLNRKEGTKKTTTATATVKEPLSKSPPEKDQVSLTSFQATVIAGRTKSFIPAWQEITADKRVLEMVQGCPIEFISMPKQLSSVYPISHNPVEREIIRS